MNNHNKPQNITFHYSLLQGAYWMGFACISAFSSVYLLSLGISNSIIGLTLSLGALASALSQPLIGILIDNNPNFTAKRVLLSSFFAITIISLLLYPLSKGVPVIIPFMYGLLMLMLQLAQPFANSIGMSSINAGYKLYFGPARAVGSLTYAFIAFVLGKVTQSRGSNVVPAFIAVSFLIGIISLFIYPNSEKPNTSNDNSDVKNEASGIAVFFKKYRSFGIIIVGLIFIYFSHVVLNSFSLQIISVRGGSSDSMGVATAISASIEIIPMFLFPFLSKKFRLSSLLKLSAIFFTLKTICTLLAPTVNAYYAAQGCQMFGWGIMAVAIVYYVNKIVDEHDTAQGQAYAGMTLTIGNVIGNFFGGSVIDHFGVNMLLLIGSIIAIIGTIIFWIGIDKSENETKKNP